VSKPLLQLSDVSKTYVLGRSGPFGLGASGIVRAVSHVDLAIRDGEVMGLVALGRQGAGAQGSSYPGGEPCCVLIRINARPS
jgi:ABC-type glutathione transport system ATPase component